MALVDQIDPGSGFVNSAVRMDNTIGTPLLSAVDALSGELIADEYTLIIGPVTGGETTVTVSCGSVNNPSHENSFPNIELDDVTVYDNIVPGANLVFDSGALEDDEAIVSIGDGTFGTIVSAGIGAGTPSDGVRHKVINTGDNLVIDAKASLLTQAIQVKKIGSVFSVVGSFAQWATEKVAGGGSSRIVPYVLTVDNTTGVDEDKVTDLSVDAVVLPSGSVRDRVTGEIVSGTGLKAIVDQTYMIVTGPLNGLIFNLDPDCVDDDEVNILIFPSRYVQIAPDVTGSEGTYGTDDVELTESGQDPGVISSSGAAFYWVRILVPGSSNNESNPYLANIALIGVDAGSAEW